MIGKSYDECGVSVVVLAIVFGIKYDRFNNVAFQVVKKKRKTGGSYRR
jgi:hypothetical protein